MTNDQIIALYENEGLSPEDIATAMPEFDIEAIKIALMGGSSKYRAMAKKSKDLFTDDSYNLAGQVMEQLLFAEEKGIVFRAAKFIINEKRGRHDKSNLRNLNVNIHMMNDNLRKAREAKIIAEQNKEIEVETTTVA